MAVATPATARRRRAPADRRRADHPRARAGQPLRRPGRARRPGPGRAPRRNPRRGRRLGHRQVGADALDPRPARAGRRRRSRCWAWMRVRKTPPDRLHIERNTGVLFQDGALFSSLTVGENVQVPLKEHHPRPARFAALRTGAAQGQAGRACRPMRSTSCPRSCPAACASAPAWPARWRWTRRCCSWTSPPPGWTRSARPPSTA